MDGQNQSRASGELNLLRQQVELLLESVRSLEQSVARLQAINERLLAENAQLREELQECRDELQQYKDRYGPSPTQRAHQRPGIAPRAAGRLLTVERPDRSPALAPDRPELFPADADHAESPAPGSVPAQ